MKRGTYFIDVATNKPIADDDEVQPIPLVKGMSVTIEGYVGEVFEVVDWNYHHGHDADMGGLRVYIKRR